jgi:hypothetical protein
MAKHEFQSTLYRTHAQMLDAIAESWLEAGGLNSEADVAAALRTQTDEELAAEVIEAWGLDQPGDDEEPSHMDREGYDEAELADGFGRFRAKRQEKPSAPEA